MLKLNLEHQSQLKATLIVIVEEFQINVTLVVTDSASTMICAFSHSPLERASCCVHLLNIICNDAIVRSPSIMEVLEHLRQITSILFLMSIILINSQP